jgi:hypothetical protein
VKLEIDDDEYTYWVEFTLVSVLVLFSAVPVTFGVASTFMIVVFPVIFNVMLPERDK